MTSLDFTEGKKNPIPSPAIIWDILQIAIEGQLDIGEARSETRVY